MPSPLPYPMQSTPEDAEASKCDHPQTASLLNPKMAGLDGQLAVDYPFYCADETFIGGGHPSTDIKQGGWIMLFAFSLPSC